MSLKYGQFQLYHLPAILLPDCEPLAKDYLCTDSAYFSFKPLKRKYNKILKSYNYKKEEIACIGDQLLTDIWGANRMDFLSILVNPIGKTDFTLTKLNRFIETSIYDKLKKQDLLKKGRYYE